MAEARVQRRLAAILAADVAGYLRLMGADEEGTLAALKELRRGLADPKIKEHRGRIVKTTGDGLLVEFASVVDAVRCAVEVQHEMAERNAGVPDERRIQFRIGIIRPDKLHATRTGGFSNVEMVFDGKTLTLLGKNANLYAQVDAPGTIDQLVDV